MKETTTRRAGDRRDGRQLHNLALTDRYTPFYTRSRRDAENLFEDAVDITEAELWLQEHAVGEFANLNLLHVLIAAYVRTAAVMPAINRFIAGQRIFARNDIEVIIGAAKSETDRRAARFVKVSFDPTDNVYDVYRKIGSAVQQLKSGANPAGQAPFSETVLQLPRVAVKLAFWALRTLDYFGKLPQRFIDSSPYHGSLSICSLSAHGVRPTYLSLGDFGNLPMPMSISTSQIHSRRALNLRVAYDSRIADVYYFTEAFAYLKELIRNPSLLEGAPETVFDDIF